MISTLVIAYFTTSAILFILSAMGIYSMKKQAIARGYIFFKQQVDFCQKFLVLVEGILIFCCPVLRFIISFYYMAGAVLGMDTEIESVSRVWDIMLKDAEQRN